METGIVNIRGKDYQTVALRVKQFRDEHPDWSVACEIIERSDACVVIRCVIADETGRSIATGYAEEYRSASQINRTSALENCETSAIGRALAAAGYGGTQFASADEVAHAISEKQDACAAADAAAQAWIDTIAGVNTKADYDQARADMMAEYNGKPSQAVRAAFAAKLKEVSA